MVLTAGDQVPTFEVKQVRVPLFGVVENTNQAAWLSAFSTAAPATQVNVDASALDIVADELELDVQGLVDDAERYVNGSYRPKARGMGGSRLGDLGEVLTFLVNRVPGREIVRVVSWRAGAGQAVKGSRFPQPDFIVSDINGAAALEVKSTEAFDFIALRDTTKKWMWLQPCSSVAGCRERALPQLGFVDGTLTPQQHSLVARGGAVVPFPVGKGIAATVVAMDGRTTALRSDPKYKTPKTCRQARRDCWACIPSSCHFVLVMMPNAPGMLSLGGGAVDGPQRWLHAYKRWSQALAACDLLAVRATLKELVEAVENWLAAPSVVEPDVLRGFWGAYLGDAMRSRGLDVEVPGRLGDLNREDLSFEWSPAPPARPTNREASVDEITRILSQAEVTDTPFLMSAQLQSDQREAESVSVRGVDDYVEFQLVSETWWMDRAVETRDNASLIAARLLSFAVQVTGLPTDASPDAVPLREVLAQIGDHAVRLGWESKPVAPTVGHWGSWLRHWPFWLVSESWPWPPWPVLLMLGDPRVRLRVTPEGRARLRVARSLLRKR